MIHSQSNMLKYILGLVAGIGVSIVLGSGIHLALAVWQGPTASPPDGNVAAPINIGAIAQYKLGILGANKLAVTDVVVINTPCDTPGTMAMDLNGLILSCQAGVWRTLYRVPEIHRIVFNYTGAVQEWTVPEGVTMAYVTMAGGGGTGLGWRIVNAIASGHSGGYVFSHPVNLIPGEKIQIFVGKGAGSTSYYPIKTGTLAVAGAPYYVYTNPTADDGLGGFPGGKSAVVSSTNGPLLECSGGSGVWAAGIDAYPSEEVYRMSGNHYGALIGGGNPVWSSPNRVAAGPYALANAPGACGPNDYGRGVYGDKQWNVSSGSYPGGMTPFGYGSGGSIGRSGCYVTTTLIGTCVWPNIARDGVVILDVIY